jgi:hydrogenase maturation protein HypF
MVEYGADQRGAPRVVLLGGGVFMNRLLTARATELLKAAGHAVYIHRSVPPNDACIALGQAVIAGRAAKTPEVACLVQV